MATNVSQLNHLTICKNHMKNKESNSFHENLSWSIRHGNLIDSSNLIKILHTDKIP